MKQRVPFYYNEFGCITSKCKDNCCIGGWEIDIDDETYERYNNMTGELKHKILDIDNTDIFWLKVCSYLRKQSYS